MKRRHAHSIDAAGRRHFLRQGALAGGLALMAPGERLGAQVRALPAAPAFEFEEATIAALQQKMAQGTLTAQRLTEAYLARIEALNRRGPELRAVIETNPDALKIAQALDAERKAKGPRGPLHGIPILLKDNVDTADGMNTTAGSLALEGSRPATDAFLAARLRQAGAILLGKANMSEWANLRSSRSTSGWSARGGQCRNPYALDRNPCGSSSGSGTAVSANLCAAAVGTETDGSIVCPSTTTGIVGIKPTVGRVSRAGVIPISHTQDTAGPMARTVSDAAALLAAMLGSDPRDAATADSVGKAAVDDPKLFDPEGLRGARIGVARNLAAVGGRVDRVFEEALAEMKRRGAILVDPAEIPHARELDEPEFEVLLYEFKADLNAYLAGRSDLSRGGAAPHLLRGARPPENRRTPTGGDESGSAASLADLIAFNEANRSREMPFFDQELFVKAQEKGDLTTPAYQEALAKCRRLSREEGIDAVMNAHSLDALVAPTGGPAWTTDLVNGDHYTGGSSTPAAVAGYPSITVPAGHVAGLPVGISFLGRAWSEPTLIRIAYAFEQATHHRRVPGLVPTLVL